MKRPTRQPKMRSLVDLLQEVQHRIETVPLDQQQSLTPLLLNLLATSLLAAEHLSPAKGIHTIPGQWHVKRALEVAAAGGHNILLVGPLDVGEAELARTLPFLLPILPRTSPLLEPACTIEKGALEQALLAELTRARGCVLFLKDLDTFDLSLLTSLSQMLQTHVHLFPNDNPSFIHPSAFLLVATVKPCQALDPAEKCRCSPAEKAQHRQRLKDVIHICFDIEIEVSPTPSPLGDEVLQIYPEENAATIRQRVESAHLIQHKRYALTTHLRVNADLREADDVAHFCQMFTPAQDLLASARSLLHLTPLQVLRVQAVARTIADLADSTLIKGQHIAEAFCYLSHFTQDE